MEAPWVKKKRGRKLGTVAGPLQGARPALLASLKVGQSFWVETSLERRHYDMRKYNPHPSRLSPTMAGMKFSTMLFTAVGSRDCTDIRYLIEVKRIA